MTRVAYLLLFAVGCGGSAKPQPTPPGSGSRSAVVADPIPQTKGPDCGFVADHLATWANTEHPGLADHNEKQREMVRAHCTDDAWSDEARNCFAAVENEAELDGCTSKLTDAQRRGIGADRKAPIEPAKADAPAPAAPDKKPHSGTRGPTRRDSSDPCEGGE